ncbi:MAG TPA: hypothetical protein VGO47_06835, partial [Chlamydiales bacterium]|nr:hypothetical protein [Chlamydiales bacterium]
LAKVWRKAADNNECLDHYFWWHGRLLWLSRNVTSSERRDIVRRVIYPEVQRTILLICAKTLSRLFFRSIDKEEQRLRAGFKGAWHYYVRSNGIASKKTMF